MSLRFAVYHLHERVLGVELVTVLVRVTRVHTHVINISIFPHHGVHRYVAGQRTVFSSINPFYSVHWHGFVSADGVLTRHGDLIVSASFYTFDRVYWDSHSIVRHVSLSMLRVGPEP